MTCWSSQERSESSLRERIAEQVDQGEVWKIGYSKE